MGLGNALASRRELFQYSVGTLSINEGFSSKDVWPSLQTITAILPVSNWSVLLLRSVMLDVVSGVLIVYPPVEAEGVCG